MHLHLHLALFYVQKHTPAYTCTWPQGLQKSTLLIAESNITKTSSSSKSRPLLIVGLQFLQLNVSRIAVQTLKRAGLTSGLLKANKNLELLHASNCKELLETNIYRKQIQKYTSSKKKKYKQSASEAGSRPQAPPSIGGANFWASLFSQHCFAQQTLFKKKYKYVKKIWNQIQF